MSPLYYVFRTHDIDPTYLEHFFINDGLAFKFIEAKWRFWCEIRSSSLLRILCSEKCRFRIRLFTSREKSVSFFDVITNLITLHQRESFLNIQIISPESERITISTSLFSSSWMICKYVFCVVVILECPNLRATLAIDTPANNNSEA